MSSPNAPLFSTVTGADFGRSIKWARSQPNQLALHIGDAMLSRAKYAEECEKLWAGFALRDAQKNWPHFQQYRLVLTEALKQFDKDPFLKDLTGKFHNPDGTLTAMLWSLQATLQPDKSRLDPFLDFEETFQTVFLRRGLKIYCKMLLDVIRRSKQPEIGGVRFVQVPDGILPPNTAVMVGESGVQSVLKWDTP